MIVAEAHRSSPPTPGIVAWQVKQSQSIRREWGHEVLRGQAAGAHRVSRQVLDMSLNDVRIRRGLVGEGRHYPPRLPVMAD